MRRGVLLIRVTVMLCTVGAASAPATVAYLYRPLPTETFIPPGNTATVPLVFEELITADSTSLLAQEGGLASIGARITRERGNASLTAAMLNPVDFSGASSRGPLLPDAFSFSEAIAPGAAGVLLGNTGGGANPSTPGNLVYLGAIRIAVPLDGVTSAFTIAPLEPLGGHTLDKSGNDLDLRRCNRIT